MNTTTTVGRRRASTIRPSATTTTTTTTTPWELKLLLGFCLVGLSVCLLHLWGVTP